MSGLKRKGTIQILFTFGIAGFLWTAEAEAEEVFSTLPKKIPVQGEWLLSAKLLHAPSPDAPFIFLEEEFPENPDWPFHLPTGSEVSMDRFQIRFRFGERAFGAFFHPRATFSYRTSGGLKSYLNNESIPVEAWERPSFQEKKISYGLHLAEQVSEALHLFPIVGNIVSGFIGVGRDMEKLNRRVRTKYNLYFEYSESTYQATYKERF